MSANESLTKKVFQRETHPLQTDAQRWALSGTQHGSPFWRNHHTLCLHMGSPSIPACWSCCVGHTPGACCFQRQSARWHPPLQNRRWSVLADALWEPGDMSVSQEGEMLPVPLPAALFSASPRFRSAAPTSHQLQDPELLSVLKHHSIYLSLLHPPFYFQCFKTLLGYVLWW